MAEYTVRSVRENLAKLLDQRSILLHDSRAEIRLLVVEFQHLEGFLKYAEKKLQGQDHRIRNVRSDVVRGAHDAEDLIETLALKIEDRRLLLKSLDLMEYHMSNLNSNVLDCRPRNGIPSLKCRKKFQALKSKIHEIVLSLNIYGLGIGQVEASNTSLNMYYDQHPPLREHRPRRSSEPVGLEEEVKQLLARLICGEARVGPLAAVAITGMGGIGKTTLVQCLYNHEKVISHFQCRLWVSVSQKFTPKSVCVDLLTQLMQHDPRIPCLESLNVPQLKTMLRVYLERNQYLIVLDDIWSKKVWDHFSGAFPDKNNASRILLTTRNNQVAMHTGVIPHPMKLFLGGEDGLDLFRKKSFEVHGVDPELEDIGKQISRHIYSECHLLPLAVVGVGSFLSQKRLRSEWQRVLRSMSPLGPRGRLENLSEILALSYKDLAPRVKSCFLRLGFFPRHQEVSCRKLLHIWLADGLVLENQSSAESCLEELIDKNLLCVRKATVDGRPKTCYVHPCIHELSIAKAKEEILLEVQSTCSYDHLSKRARHKVILSASNRFFHSQTLAPGLRSLLFFLPQKSPIPIDQLHLVFKQFKLLRVLDLEGLDIGDRLPSGIGKLQNLRYLNLRHTCIKRLHRSMCHLRRLLVLDVRGCSEVSGLDVIKEMTSLTHVYLDKKMERGLVHLQFESLTQLRYIGWVSQHDLLANNVKQLMQLRKLKLKISATDREIMGKAWEVIAALHQLSFLQLQVLGTGNIDNTGELFPSNIKQITLCGVNISSNLLSVLTGLPKLTLLKLKECSFPEEYLTLDVNGFRRLAYIEFFRLKLKELRLQNGNSLRRLRGLRISQCKLLTRLPNSVYSVIECL